jgi:N-acetylglucosamine kinase-like BadF-type ATPase
MISAIGLDLGGSNARFVALDEDGNRQLEGSLPGRANFQTLGHEGIKTKVLEIFNQYPQLSLDAISFVTAAVAGAESSQHNAAVEHGLRECFPENKASNINIIATNDTDIGFNVLDPSKLRLVLVSGTGFNLKLREPDSTPIHQVGGSGPLLSDDFGGGFGIGRIALLEVHQELQQRKNRSQASLDLKPCSFLLDAAFEQKFVSEDIRSIYELMYPKDTPPPYEKIASFARSVLQAASFGDTKAQRILYQTAAYIADTCKNLIADNTNLREGNMALLGSIINSEEGKRFIVPVLERSFKNSDKVIALHHHGDPAALLEISVRSQMGLL